MRPLKQKLAALSGLYSKSIFLAAAVGLTTVLCWNWWFGPDIWYHLRLGRNLVHHGFSSVDNVLLHQPGFINCYWLYEVLNYALYTLAGTFAIQAMGVLLWISIGTIWYREFLRQVPPAWAVALTLSAAVCCHYRFEPRPEVFSYLFLSVFVAVAFRWWNQAEISRKELLCLCITQVLWANMHGFFFMGCAVIGAVAVAFLLRSARGQSRAAWILVGVLALLAMVSPWGWRNWLHPWYMLQALQGLSGEVQEFHSPWTGQFATMWPIWIFTATWVCIAVVTLKLLLQAARAQSLALILAFVGLALSAVSIRNIPVLYLLAAPAIASCFQLAGARKQGSSRKATRWYAGGTLLCIIVAILAIDGSFYRSIRSETGFGNQISDYAYPVAATRLIHEKSLAGPLFNHPSDGGYLSFHLPHVKVFGDSRFVDATLVQQYFSATRTISDFENLREQHQFQAVLLKVSDNANLIADLIQSRKWKLKYTDLHRALLVPQGPNDVFVWGPQPVDGSFYQGQDLTLRIHAWSAIQWVRLLGQMDATKNLRDALSDLDRAPRIPSPVIEFALEFAKKKSDGTLWNQAQLLRARMYSLSDEDTRIVDSLLRSGLHPK
jgi:hypothetical protein